MKSKGFTEANIQYKSGQLVQVAMMCNAFWIPQYFSATAPLGPSLIVFLILLHLRTKLAGLDRMAVLKAEEK